MIDSSCEYMQGHYYIENTLFDTNGSDKGGIFNIEEIDYNSSIKIKDSVFSNNFATYGGVIYSLSKLTPKLVSFNNCEFIDNTASEGKISYRLLKVYEPYISNTNELREIKMAFATNPTGIKFSENSLISFSILSGEIIPDGIICEFIDDYGNIPIFWYTSIDLKNYNDLNFYNYVFFNLEVEDNKNLAIIGKPISYCLLGGCKLPLIKIIGNPGTHKLIFKVDLIWSF